MRLRSFIGGLVLLAAGPATAGDLGVSPVVVQLSPDSKSALLALRNGGGEEARFQVSVFAWGESASGEMKLSPTQEIAFYPVLLTLAAGEERNLRVGTAVGFGPVEKTYRLFIEELPPPARAGREPQVRVLTRVGIPIFLAPTVPAAARGEVARTAVERGALRFQLRNVGNVRLRPRAVVVTGAGSDGKPMFEKRLEGWYILAGGERDYQVAIPPESCARVRRVSVSAPDDRVTLAAAVDTPGGACVP